MAQLSPIKAAELLVYAFERGITTFDTARSFHSRELLAHAFGGNPDITIIDKSVARTYEEMERDVAESLVELGRDEADIFCSTMSAPGRTLLRERERGTT